MRCTLNLRSPSNGTGWQDRWDFSGRDDRILRDCLAQLDEFAAPVPVERREGGRFVIEAEDRWHAAMLLYPDEPAVERTGRGILQAEAAWTASGALRLAELLPEELEDLRADILRRFGT